MTDIGHPPDATVDGADEARLDGAGSVSQAAAGAPPVVAVVVTHDPGPWLEEALSSLVAQDYPNLSILVLDAASHEDPTARIAAIAPAAYVRRVAENHGFGPTANDLLNVVEGASHYVLLHDDVALEPDAVRLLLEEAYRSNAGVVAPKIVAWDDPRLLLAVGASADKSGHVVAYGRGERDQEQHDAVRDVFVAPGGCQLVRADLFAALGGFDPAIVLLGEDVDLSWRAQVAGARVVVAPAARVRHREATVTGERPLAVASVLDAERVEDLAETLSRLDLRHRVRTVCIAYGRVHALRVLPQAFLLMLFEAVAARRGAVRRMLGAWRWNLNAISDIREMRKRVATSRVVADGEIRRLQTRGTTRIAAALRGSIAAEERALGVGAAGRELAGAITQGGVRSTVAVWLTLVLVFLVGSRHLIGQGIPAIGQLLAPPDDPWETLQLFFAGWHPSGLGSSASPPFGFLLAGLGGTVLLGAEDLLQKIALLGALPVGVVGMHRLASPLGSWRPRLVGALLYAAVPLPYDALARGRWSALVSYALMPWAVARLLRATGLPPFGAPAAPEATGRRRRRRAAGPRTPADAVEALLGAEAGTLDQVDTEELRVAAIAVAGRHPAVDDESYPQTAPPVWVRHPGSSIEQVAPAAILFALAVALSPPVGLAILVASVAVAVGFAAVGPRASGAGSLRLGLGALGGAAVLLVPWSIELLTPGTPWALVGGVGAPRADAPGLGELLAFHVGDMPLAPLAAGVLVAAVLPLLVGTGWRLQWATRLWVAAVFTWIVAWAAGRGWLLVDPPAADVLIAPAAVAIVLAASLGLSAFERDLPGYDFGWRQLASIAAALAGLVATVPMLAAAVDGRWRIPPRDFAGVLSWMPEEVPKGDFRVLWVGAPDAIPGDGWRLSDGLAYTTSRNGPGDITMLWPGPDDGATGLLADALAVARRGETTRVGALLGPLGVRYVAVPRAAAPAGQEAPGSPPPVGLLDALRGQVDLRVINVDDSLVLFENAAWEPIRSIGAQPVLQPGSAILHSTGDVAAGTVHVAEAHSDRWSLEVNGADAPQSKVDNWANGFQVAGPGRGTLSYSTPPVRYLLLLVELALWIGAIRFAVLTVRRRRAAIDAERGASLDEGSAR